MSESRVASGRLDAAPATSAVPPLALLAAWLLATMWLRPLMVPDEGRYVGVAREMVLSGDWLLPTLNGLPFFHKPPLMYWIDGVGIALFGATGFAARLAPALGAWIMGAALFLHLRRWHGAAVARAGLGLLATMPFFYVGGQYANHDMLVAGCVTAAVLALVRAVDDPRRGSLRWLLVGWVFCALGVLAKGLIGVVLPALVVGPWLLAQRRWKPLLWLAHPLGIALAAAIALPWMWAMQSRHPGFFDYFIVEQHFRRYAQTNFNNAQPFWFFFAVLPVLTLPWSFWLPVALRRAFGSAPRAGPVSGRARLDARGGLHLWWLLAVPGFFSLPNSKLVGYVLPALPALAALLAPVLAGRRRLPPVRAFAGLACVAIVAALAWQAPHSSRDAARALAAEWRPGDRVVFVDQYFFDFAFYAGLREPPIVLGRWDDPEIARRDNWRKELFDAARFAPERGRLLLWPLQRGAELLCHDAAVWFVGSPAAQALLAGLVPAPPQFVGANARLWRADGRRCATADAAR